MLNTVLAYLLWGFFPAFFPLLLPASPLEIIAHRVIWTAVLMVVVILINGAWRELRDASAKTWGYLALAGVLITANWGIYVLAVNTDHVADAVRDAVAAAGARVGRIVRRRRRLAHDRLGPGQWEAAA